MIVWHVNNPKMTHKSPGAVMAIIEWICGIYDELCISRGPQHGYLGMDLNYPKPGKVKIGMEKYTYNILAEFLEDFCETSESLAAEYLFTVRDDAARQPLLE